MESGWVSGLGEKIGSGEICLSLARVEAETRPTLRRSSIMVGHRSTSIPSLAATSASVGSALHGRREIARRGFHLLVAGAYRAMPNRAGEGYREDRTLDAVLGVALKRPAYYRDRICWRRRTDRGCRHGLDRRGRHAREDCDGFHQAASVPAPRDRGAMRAAGERTFCLERRLLNWRFHRPRAGGAVHVRTRSRPSASPELRARSRPSLSRVRRERWTLWFLQ